MALCAHWKGLLQATSAIYQAKRSRQGNKLTQAGNRNLRLNTHLNQGV